MAVWVVAVMTKATDGIHMTRIDDSRGTDSDEQSDLFYTYDW